MLVTTTSTLEGREIVDYLGIVSGETIIGANKETALREMSEQAERMGANAVIGVDLDYETVGSSGSMLMVTAAGTAVRYR